ncbi:MAG: hypothetical protein CMD02_03580 [Flavobacteriales bacterium]|nr:hypothetical protein [Flavobacteriales bacterium]|tara:strand:+ start:3802 stop:4965 length:1164 start_codon:yes stop_codon:yes gene_type:complete
MKFSNILAPEGLKKQLINSVKNNRLAHSQMFLGEKSSPKLLLALAYAQFISCQHKSSDDSCGSCQSCVKYQKLTHPDLHLIFPVLPLNKSSSSNVSDNFVKEWRECVLKNPFLDLDVWFDVFSNENRKGKTGYIYAQESDNLRKKLSLKHYESQLRVVLIWLPEKMQVKTSNKLLKLLEEPPQKTIFLLVSENTDLILNTILSRLQITKVHNYNPSEIEALLRDKFPMKHISEIKATISLTEGNLGGAIKILHNESFEDRHFEEYQNWMRLCYSVNIEEITKWVDIRSKKGRRSQTIFLKYALKMTRNCLVFHFSETKNLFVTQKEIDFLTKFHPFIHQDNINEISEKLEECIKNIERNANSKIMFYELSLQLMKLLKVKRKFVEIN